LTGCFGASDGSVGQVCAFLKGPDSADFAGFAHPEGGEHLEVLGLFLDELVETVAVAFRVAHGGNLQSAGLESLYVLGEGFQFLLVRDAGEVVLGDDDAHLAAQDFVVKLFVIPEVVPFQVKPFRHFGGIQDILPQFRAFHGAGVVEGSAIVLKADGANLQLPGGNLANAFRKLGPKSGVKKVVTDFQCPAGFQIQADRVERVFFGGFQGLGANEPHQVLVG